MRLIDADTLIEWLSIVPLENGMINPDVVVEFIRAMPDCGGWISVKDQLPRSRQWVLCKCRAGIYEVLRYEETCDGDQWHHDNRHNYMSDFVTHWMPMPEPPEEN